MSSLGEMPAPPRRVPPDRRNEILLVLRCCHLHKECFQRTEGCFRLQVAKAHTVGAKVLEELEWFDFVESITEKSKAFKAKEKIDPIEEVMMEIEEAESKKTSPKKVKSESSNGSSKGTSPKKQKVRETSNRAPEPQPNTSTEKVPPQAPALMWVDKYMPSATKQIIGQQGDQSNVAKLRRWLTQWSTKQKVPFNKFKNPTGAGLRAALLSGPPGVGKTTSAHLVCKELGFEVGTEWIRIACHTSFLE